MTVKDKQDKRTLLFAAVWALLEQGRDPLAISISQVAQTAGVGKGTVYEYFSSKEDLFAQAIASSWIQQIEQMEQVDQSLPFQPRFYAIFTQAEQRLSQQRSLLTMMLKQYNRPCGSPASLPAHLFALREQLCARLTALLRSLYEQGVTEGVLSAGATDLDLFFAAIAVATVFHLWPQAGETHSPFSGATQRLDFCYATFCKLVQV